MLHDNLEIDLKLIGDPTSITYKGQEGCFFQAVSLRLDINSIPPNKILEEIYNVYEIGNHAKYTLKYMKKGSLCSVRGVVGYVDAVNSDNEPYKKKSVREGTTSSPPMFSINSIILLLAAG